MTEKKFLPNPELWKRIALQLKDASLAEAVATLSTGIGSLLTLAVRQGKLSPIELIALLNDLRAPWTESISLRMEFHKQSEDVTVGGPQPKDAAASEPGSVRLIFDEQLVDAYLAEHELLEGNVPIRAVLLQLHGTAAGRPAVMFAFELSDKQVIGKITYRMLQAAMGGINGTLQRLQIV